MARRATLVDSLRRQNPDFVLLDAGAFSEKRAPLAREKSTFLYRMMGRLGYDATALGAEDLEICDTTVVALAEGPPLVLTNVYREENGTATPVAAESVIRDVSGVRIGIFALLDPSSQEVLQTRRPGLVVTDPFPEAERILAEFENEGVDITVLLSQLQRSLVDSILGRYPAIDVTVLGHRTTMDHNWARKFKDRIVQVPAARGRGISRVDLEVTPDGAFTVIEASNELVATVVMPDEDVQALVDEMHAQIKRAEQEDRMARQLEYDSTKGIDRYLGDAVCARCHLPEHEAWQASAHARAFETLAGLGMEASVDCLPCHTVGHGEETGFRTPRSEPDLGGVQCESCHGLGSHHFEPLPADRVRTLCVRCHDKQNSPEFELDAYLAKIRHWQG